MCYKDAGDGHCTQSTQQDMHHSRQTATAEEPWAADCAVRWGRGHSNLTEKVTCCGSLGNISQQIPLSIIFGSDVGILMIKYPGNKVLVDNPSTET